MLVMAMADQTEGIWNRLEWHWRYLLLIAIGTAIVHLVATFMATSDSSRSAYYRLAAALPTNAMQLLEPISPKHQPLPFLSPDARYAVCKFSSAKGPIDVRAVLPDRGWTIGIYNTDGSTAYFAAGAIARPINIALTIIAGDDRFVGLSPLTLGATANPEITISAREGLIVVRAPDRGSAYQNLDVQEIVKASCTARSY
jgi:uncharacterized membrane protein